jgi:hypothetical protein
MYGESLDPEKTSFGIWMDDNEIVIFLNDDEDDSNDDIRDVDHPLFDLYFDNTCECMFTTSFYKTIDEAREMLLSFGMTEDKSLEGSIGG